MFFLGMVDLTAQVTVLSIKQRINKVFDVQLVLVSYPSKGHNFCYAISKLFSLLFSPEVEFQLKMPMFSLK